MNNPLREHWDFYRQFRDRFHTTGAVAPSSRFLARALTRPLAEHDGSARILEIGPGTGAVTRWIVPLLKPDDRLELVELNEAFADILRTRFAQEEAFHRVADHSIIHVCPLQEFETVDRYDFIVSGLPLNNFSAELAREILEKSIRLLAPGGVLSYFEYMYVRPVRKRLGRNGERERLTALDQVLKTYLDRYRFRQDSVYTNLPPAWVQHLRTEQLEAAT